MAPDLPTPTVTSTGTVLAERYHLGRLIARGGMADVFEAHDALLDRRVAVKVFRAAEAAHRERFDAEVRLLAGLNHPGLVAVYDAGERAGDGYMVLELVEGPTLRDVLADRAPLPDREVAALGATLADALAHVHERGIVHRDLTPANVLCGTDGSPRLTDFGIARLLDTTRVTAEHLTIGTVGYMAPEQVEGGDVTPAADVYALGLVLLEALTAKPAFTGPSHEVAVARLTRDPAVPSELPSPWPDLLRSMTARRPEERPTAAAVAARLREARPGSSRATGLLTVGAAPGDRTRRAPAVVVPSSEPAADPHAQTASLPVAGSGPVPSGAPSGRAQVTSVMPVAMLPVDEAASAGAARGSAAEPATTDEHAATEAPLAAALAAGAAGVQGAVGNAAQAVRRRARRLTFHQWLAVAAAAVFVLAVWQSGRGDWSAQVLAARAAAEAEAPVPTTTTVAPTTTTTAAPVAPAPIVEDDDDRGEGQGKGKGKDKGDDDD